MPDNENIKRNHTPEFKTAVVLELLKEEDTLAKISNKHGIHPTQARRWREVAMISLKNIFSGKPQDAQLAQKDKQIEELTRLIGQKEIDLNFVKKKVGLFSH